MFELKDEGLVLSLRHHGESGLILNLFTHHYGRYAGLIHTKTPLQIGTLVSAIWRARLPEHLGNFTCETLDPISVRYLDDKARLAAISCLCALLTESLPEREALPLFYEDVWTFLTALDMLDWQSKYVRLEAKLLTFLGFGMDLTACAGGGDANDLAYVSPKTARAVSRQKGDPYRERLLPLPAFLWQDVPATSSDLQDGLTLTGYFLSKHLSLPPIRRQILS